MAEAACLAIHQLSVQIQNKLILDGLSFEVEAGASVGIIGPNGSGKTTLLQAVLGFLPLSSGSIFLSGCDMGRLSSVERARRIAYVAQESASALPFTVKTFLELAYFPWRQSLLLSEWEVQLERLCAEFKLLDKLSRQLGTLSGGERQRVMLVQSLLQRPQLLLLDEITNHLDIFYQLETLQYLCQQRMTKVMVLHDINLAARYCDSLIMLKEGQCMAAGPTAKVLTEESLGQLFGVPCEIVKCGDRIKYIVMGLAD